MTFIYYPMNHHFHETPKMLLIRNTEQPLTATHLKIPVSNQFQMKHKIKEHKNQQQQMYE